MFILSSSRDINRKAPDYHHYYYQTKYEVSIPSNQIVTSSVLWSRHRGGNPATWCTEAMRSEKTISDSPTYVSPITLMLCCFSCRESSVVI